jgi:hypothetical protein
MGRRADRRSLEGGDRPFGRFEGRAQDGGDVALAVGREGVMRSLKGGIEPLGSHVDVSQPRRGEQATGFAPERRFMSVRIPQLR